MQRKMKMIDQCQINVLFYVCSQQGDIYNNYKISIIPNISYVAVIIEITLL